MVDFDPIWSWPKPVQKPHPPIYVGGDGEHTLKRVVEYGDAWLPIAMRGRRPLGERIVELQEMAAAAGRGPIPVTVYGAQPRPEVIAHYAEIGVERCVFFLPPVVEADALLLLDRYGRTTEEFAKTGV
jgi:alkanesulfonate monooxygenase SsuD/methylene tetrahydromethanopterin reductase-like flavin-dependent oxidoreductase (luciferase family)